MSYVVSQTIEEVEDIDFKKDIEFICIIFSKHHLGKNILPQIAINIMSLLDGL